MGTVNKFSQVIGRKFLYPEIKDSISKSHKLFVELGLTPKISHGLVALTPMLKKSLRKLESLVHNEMRSLSALEMSLPILTDSKLFSISNRVDYPNLMKVHLNERTFVLSPTCEEAMTEFLKLSNILNFAYLPLRCYQISPKFRDERRAKCGLMRTREFIMKDLYCFDADALKSDECYQEVIKKYHHFFDLLKVPYKYIKGSSENVGGSLAHEFHFLTESGEDNIKFCENCGYNVNLNVEVNKNECGMCQSKSVKIERGIEVGHAFKIGTNYTKAFDVCNRKTGDPLHMTCYGLGLTRILAASVEVLCKPNEIRWPFLIAPYIVCVLPPKLGSKEEKVLGNVADNIYHNLNEILDNDVILHDVTDETIGYRFNEAKKFGFPFIVVLGKTVLESPPRVEIYSLHEDEISLIQFPDVTQFILDKLPHPSEAKYCSKKNHLNNIFY